MQTCSEHGPLFLILTHPSSVQGLFKHQISSRYDFSFRKNNFLGLRENTISSSIFASDITDIPFGNQLDGSVLVSTHLDFAIARSIVASRDASLRTRGPGTTLQL